MSEPSNVLQSAIYARLIGYTALTTALGGVKVYDHVPQGTDAPYVLIGDDTLIGADTKTANGWDGTIMIHIWSFEVAGRKTVKTLMGLVYDALHRQEASITITGFTLVNLACEFQQTIPEIAEEGSNDHYYHGVMRFRALISETSNA